MRRVVLAITMLLVVVSASRSQADDHHPPRTTLRVGIDDEQQGILLSYCWIEASGDGFIERCADGPWRFPDTTSTPYGAQHRIRFWTTSLPTRLHGVAWALTDRGEPVGPPETIEISPIFRDGAWEGDLELPIPCRPYHLAVQGWWDDADGFGQQDAMWTFSLRQGTALPLLAQLC